MGHWRRGREDATVYKSTTTAFAASGAVSGTHGEPPAVGVSHFAGLAEATALVHFEDGDGAGQDAARAAEKHGSW